MKKENLIYGKYLFPYFGGKAAAPHKIKIKLSFL
jgi:hypothetical protein